MSIGLNPQMINKTITFSQQDKGQVQTAQNQVKRERTFNDKILKPAVFLSSVAGVLLVVSSIAKRQGVNILKENSFSNIFKPHKWKIFKEQPEAEDVIKIASGSIAGGLLAGIALDKENTKVKLREAFQQMLGNIIVPITCVTLGIKNYQKLNEKYKLEEKIPEIKSSKMLTKILKETPKVLASMGPLAIGIIGGNWLANKLSQKLFDVTDKRKIKPGDFSGHLDDLCLAALLINPASKISHVAGNLIPIALLVSGFESGTEKSSS